jgi:pimeloyl-ACP methyl ester carboxylesterase
MLVAMRKQGVRAGAGASVLCPQRSRRPRSPIAVPALACCGMFSGFTPSHRGGSGSPLVCLHGFMDTWRSWELVLPMLERRHDVLAMTLPGHAGGPPLDGTVGTAGLVDAVEHELDAVGLETAHLVGNSLGGYVALQLAARGRAATVVAFAPAGGWAQGDRSYEDLLLAQRELQAQMKTAAPHAEAFLATGQGRRRATQLIMSNFEHIPTDLLAYQMLGIASCTAAGPLIEHALREGWTFSASRITCPVRIVWGTADELLPWPQAAGRYRTELPQADWVLLDGIGHSPQLDVPLEAAQLILGFTN